MSTSKKTKASVRQGGPGASRECQGTARVEKPPADDERRARSKVSGGGGSATNTTRMRPSRKAAARGQPEGARHAHHGRHPCRHADRLEGGRSIFGLPGDGINGIMEALRTRQEKIAFVRYVTRNRPPLWRRPMPSGPASSASALPPPGRRKCRPTTPPTSDKRYRRLPAARRSRPASRMSRRRR